MNRVFALVCCCFLLNIFPLPEIFAQGPPLKEERTDSLSDFITAYYPYIHRAEEANLFADFPEAIDNYAEAFSECKGFASDYFAAAEVAARGGKKDTAFKWMRLAARNGVTLKQFKKSSAFKIYRRTDPWSAFLRDYPSLYRAYLNDLNLDLRKEIAEMVEADQNVRRPRNVKKHPEGVAQADSIHFKRIKRILTTKGFPGEKLIGNYWVDKNPDANADILFQHFAFRDSAEVIQILLDAVRKGDCPPLLLGFTVDLMRAVNGDRQIYGTFVGHRNRVYPIENEKEVDERRKSIGLENFDLFLLKNRLEYFFLEDDPGNKEEEDQGE